MTKQEIDKLYELQKAIHEKHTDGSGDYHCELLEQERVAAGANLTERELHSVKVLLNYCIARGIPRETAFQLLTLVGFQISENGITKQEIDKLYELQRAIHEKHTDGSGDYHCELLEQERVAAGANLTAHELHSVKVLLNYCIARGIPRETAYQLLALVGFRISEVRYAN